MNISTGLINLDIKKNKLDKKKEQTDYKIKYVQEYVRLWLLVNVNRSDVNSINFIDCMCNSGVYYDGDLSTSMEVLLLFLKASEQHKDKTFNLYLNDISIDKIEILNKVICYLMPNKPLNINIYI